MKVEPVVDVEGNVIDFRRVDQERGNGVYHPRKGWKVKRAFHQHLLLNSLLRKIGLSGVMA